jgi:hypothetical protein
MTIDQNDRLFVAANGGGQVWRVETDGSYCALATGLLLPSAVGFGSSRDGTGFAATSLFAVTFSGSVIEMPGARPMPPLPQAGRPTSSVCSRGGARKAKKKKRKKRRTSSRRICGAVPSSGA